MSQHTHISGGIQRGPRLADNFTIISNAVLNDDRLSFRARGVLMWLLSKPADWRTRSEAIADQSPTEGRDAIRTAMRELETLGYLVRVKAQDGRGRWSTLQTIYEEPVTSAVPGPGKSHPGQTDVGRSGANTKDRSPRTETNNNPAPRERSLRQCDASGMSLLSEKTRAILDQDNQHLTDLEAAVHAAGIPVSFGKMNAKSRGQVSAMLDIHGIPSLVDAAKRSQRPDNPTRHVHGLLPTWLAMPLPRITRTTAPLCGQCVEGWLEDDADGRAVKCPCRTTGSAANA